MAAKAVEMTIGLPDTIDSLAATKFMVQGSAILTKLPIAEARAELRAMVDAALRDKARVSIADRVLN